MEWANLKEMRCPKCGRDDLEVVNMGYACQWSDCDFKISHDALRRVVNNLYKGAGCRRYNPDAVDRSDWQ